MTVPTKDNTFVNGPGNKIDAPQVNKNFDELYDTLNPAVIGIQDDNVAAGAGIKASKLAIPSARVFKSSAMSIPNSTNTVITFDSERFDNDTIHDTVTNSSRLTCKTAGVYLIAGGIYWTSLGGTTRKLSILLNGTTELVATNRSSGFDTSLDYNVATLYKLAVNDYVELAAFQDSGGAINVAVVGNKSPEFSMAWQSLG